MLDDSSGVNQATDQHLVKAGGAAAQICVLNRSQKSIGRAIPRLTARLGMAALRYFITTNRGFTTHRQNFVPECIGKYVDAQAGRRILLA